MKNNNQKLSTNGLYKRYGKRWVVRDVDLNVNKGEIVGLLGPNGAGKTTTFYMITGMIKPTKGHIILNERDITNRARVASAYCDRAHMPRRSSSPLPWQSEAHRPKSTRRRPRRRDSRDNRQHQRQSFPPPPR